MWMTHPRTGHISRQRCRGSGGGAWGSLRPAVDPYRRSDAIWRGTRVNRRARWSIRVIAIRLWPQAATRHERLKRVTRKLS